MQGERSLSASGAVEMPVSSPPEECDGSEDGLGCQARDKGERRGEVKQLEMNSRKRRSKERRVLEIELVGEEKRWRPGIARWRAFVGGDHIGRHCTMMGCFDSQKAPTTLLRIAYVQPRAGPSSATAQSGRPGNVQSQDAEE